MSTCERSARSPLMLSMSAALPASSRLAFSTITCAKRSRARSGLHGQREAERRRSGARSGRQREAERGSAGVSAHAAASASPDAPALRAIRRPTQACGLRARRRLRARTCSRTLSALPLRASFPASSATRNSPPRLSRSTSATSACLWRRSVSRSYAGMRGTRGAGTCVGWDGVGG